MNRKNSELLKKLTIDRNWNRSTQTSYKTALNHYCNVNGLSIMELLKEAEIEEEKIPWKKSKLRQRLIDFRTHLYENYNISTAKLYLTRIMTFYRSFDITILSLPYISEKGVKKTEPISFRDLPDKEIIKKAVDFSSHDLKAIILFMSSSGCARAETLSLTIKDFIISCSEYHSINLKNPTEEEIIKKFIEKMLIQKNIIPSFKIRRQKTDKFYYTFCSPEATEAILTYLLVRQDVLKLNKKLFKINASYFFKKFAEINKTLNLGKVGGKNRFRSHMLRKYHASRLVKSSIDEKTGKKLPGMTINNIDALQGRGKSTTQNSYFFDDFENLKEEYIQNLNKLTINQYNNGENLIDENINRSKRNNNKKMILETMHKLQELLEVLS